MTRFQSTNIFESQATYNSPSADRRAVRDGGDPNCRAKWLNRTHFVRIRINNVLYIIIKHSCDIGIIIIHTYVARTR